MDLTAHFSCSVLAAVWEVYSIPVPFVNMFRIYAVSSGSQLVSVRALCVAASLVVLLGTGLGQGVGVSQLCHLEAASSVGT